MSLEIVLIPLAFALTKEIVEGISEFRENQYTIIETRMKDENLLKQALEEWDCSFRQVEEPLDLKIIYDNEVTFIIGEQGCYSLVLPNSADKGEYMEWISNVEESYTHYLQQSVYQNLIYKAKQQGLILEKEEVLEDNSIQVTYILNQ
ncbi:hypothetical protein V1503_02480 [Bacillus sp. SCS-151]|uniref:hypothetical protein n=1 Tax=Nanhaiella sioensis TaxID=3115293 RepID=UPI00397CE392